MKMFKILENLDGGGMKRVGGLGRILRFLFVSERKSTNFNRHLV